MQGSASQLQLEARFLVYKFEGVTTPTELKE